MSDPVTNIEIEDVLSSIRKLVADGDKARTRDPAQDAGFEQRSDSPVVEARPPAKPDKLVLTPAFLVADSIPTDDQTEDSAPHEAELPDMQWEEIDDDPTLPAQDNAHFPQDPAATATDDQADADVTDWNADQSRADRSRLETSIAELEAAVSSDDDDFEPDGSESGAETFYWPGSMVRPLHEIEDAETDEADTAADDEGHSDVQASDDSHNADSADDLHEDEASSEDDTEESWTDDSWADDDAAEDDASVGGAAEDNTTDDKADVYADDDLDDLLAEGAEGMDEEALRKLISEIVREELMGTLGERITRNVRKLVRREIYRILSSQDFD